MTKNNHSHSKDSHSHSHSVADHTHALLDATAESADEKIVAVRNRLSAALTAAKDTCAAVQEKAVQSAKAADKMIRAKPYQAVGIAFGVGALVGYLISRRSSRD